MQCVVLVLVGGVRAGLVVERQPGVSLVGAGPPRDMAGTQPGDVQCAVQVHRTAAPAAAELEGHAGAAVALLVAAQAEVGLLAQAAEGAFGGPDEQVEPG